MQGQSLSTIDKERQLAALCSQERNILRLKPTILHERPFYWIDLNAGYGYNKEHQVIGSPLVFLNVMYDIPYRAWFIDHDPEATRELEERTRSYRGIQICTRDNRDALLEIQSRLPSNPVGGILADPNTWAYRSKAGNGIPLRELKQFCRLFPRMDLLMNLNTRVYSMMDGHNRNGHPGMYPDLVPLEEFPSFFHRQHWLISYSHNGHTGFVRLAGRNMRTGDYTKWGWYHWDSPQGQRIRQNSSIRKKDWETGQLTLSLE